MDLLPPPEPERKDVTLDDEAYSKTNTMIFMLIAFYCVGGLTALAAWGDLLTLAIVGGISCVVLIARLYIIGGQLDDLMSQVKPTDSVETE